MGYLPFVFRGFGRISFSFNTISFVIRVRVLSSAFCYLCFIFIKLCLLSQVFIQTFYMPRVITLQVNDLLSFYLDISILLDIVILWTLLSFWTSFYFQKGVIYYFAFCISIFLFKHHRLLQSCVLFLIEFNILNPFLGDFNSFCFIAWIHV